MSLPPPPDQHAFSGCRSRFDDAPAVRADECIKITFKPLHNITALPTWHKDLASALGQTLHSWP